MGYQESWLYIEPQHKFKKLIQAYEKAEQSGYYEVAGAEPHSVIVLKQPFGDIPTGKKLLWVCGDRGFHCAAGVFGGELKCSGRLRVIPVEEVLDGTDDPRMEGLDFDSPAPSENAYMKRYSVANYCPVCGSSNMTARTWLPCPMSPLKFSETAFLSVNSARTSLVKSF